MNSIVIEGQRVSLAPIPQDIAMSLRLELLVCFDVATFSFNGTEMLINAIQSTD